MLRKKVSCGKIRNYFLTNCICIDRVSSAFVSFPLSSVSQQTKIKIQQTSNFNQVAVKRNTQIHTRFVKRVARRVPLVEKELLTLAEHPSSHPCLQWGSCCMIFSLLCSVLQIIVCPFVSSNPVNCEVYSIQHYVIQSVSDLRQVGDVLRVLRFPPPIKLTATI